MEIFDLLVKSAPSNDDMIKAVLILKMRNKNINGGGRFLLKKKSHMSIETYLFLTKLFNAAGLPVKQDQRLATSIIKKCSHE